MIAVRIPEEIRKYKEKILLGLNIRQLLASALAICVCVPIYLYGRKYIGDEAASWLIMFIAIPLGAIGFFKYNGMPMERFMISLFKFEFLFPMKRKYKTENAFRDWQNISYTEEKPKTSSEKRKYKKYYLQSSLEKTVLMIEAEEQGNIDFDVDKQKLLTTKKPPQKKRPKKKKENKSKTTTANKSKSFLKLEEKAKIIEGKMHEDPSYIPDNKERRVLKKWNLALEKLRKKEIQLKKKQVVKINNTMKKRRTAKLTIPRTTQQSIPYIADYEEGLFEVKPNKYSKMYSLQDINYRIAKEDEQIQIFCKLGEFLNYFSEDIQFAICIDNRIVSMEEQEKRIFYPLANDGYDGHRTEYNRILKKQLTNGRNDIQVEKYLTVTIDAASPIEALMRFRKIDSEIIDNLRKIGSDGRVLETPERLAYYHDKFRRGREGDFRIDFKKIMEYGISSKDYIAPASIQADKKHIQIDDTYYRTLYLCNLPASLSDEFLFEIYNNDFPVTTTLNIQPVAQDRGLKIVKRQLTGIEKDKIEAEKRAFKSGYSPETIQHSIKDAHKQAEILYDDLLNKNQKMFFVTITCMVQGDTLEELEENCKVIESKARKYTCQLLTLNFQQEEGYKITMPFGYTPQDICVERALTTESTSIFMPFSNQELFQMGGYYYGLNQISHNLVVVNRLEMKTPSGFVLGTSGSGKSFATKREILNVLLHDNETDLLIIDPENEYADFCRAFGGTVLKISADSDVNINPMDMSEDYGLDEDDDENISLDVKKEKAIKKKSDYIMSIVERMISVGTNADTTSITPVQKTIVDRCVARCYKEYLDHDFDIEYLPTLMDLQNELDKERDSVEGREVAEGVEYYTRGSMNVFAKKTNINVDNRLVVFNVRDLGDQLRQIGLIIIFDFIWNRMVRNKNKGVRTYCYCDEIHVMFQSYYSANFLKQLYKRGRKYGLCITGITQNVEDLLKSEQARGMIGNSDFIMMLNQNSEDLRLLAAMRGLSETQMEYVRGAEAGSGLLIADNVVVPFVDRFPKESYLYKLMSTKFGEDMSKAEVDKIVSSLVQQSKKIAEVAETDNFEEDKIDLAKK